jgi:biotin synthase
LHNATAVNAVLNKIEVLGWLRETNPDRLAELWRRADETRRNHVGGAVHLRGLVEISNFCVRQCAYCGLRAGNANLARYRMTTDEILEAAHQAVQFGYGTVVLQGGEDYCITTEWMAEVIRRIKGETPLAVTLSLGERPDKDLAAWRAAGADRYLLRFETSDRGLFDEIHQPLGSRKCDRIAILRRLRELDFEVGSGIMVGIPGQTYDSVANDIALFRELDLDMIGIGPFIPHPATPLGSGFKISPPVHSERVPNSELMVYKAVALTRLVRPDANIPATTALATINKKNGRELGLQRGANVFMPNLTPLRYRRLYEIYPDKACIAETGEACNGCLGFRIRSLGRHIGSGAGGRRDRQIIPKLETARVYCHA